MGRWSCVDKGLRSTQIQAWMESRMCVESQQAGQPRLEVGNWGWSWRWEKCWRGWGRRAGLGCEAVGLRFTWAQSGSFGPVQALGPRGASLHPPEISWIPAVASAGKGALVVGGASGAQAGRLLPSLPGTHTSIQPGPALQGG